MLAKVGSVYDLECWRRGDLVWHENVHNLVCIGGLNTLLYATFSNGGQWSQWWMGLINNAGFSSLQWNDVMSSHPGWAETTGYNEATRPPFWPSPVANAYLDNNGARAQFTINTAHAIRGAFLVNEQTKGGTANTLYGEAAFAAPRNVAVGDVVLVKLACQITSS